MRFVAVQEPPHSWAVFDTGNDAPAEYAGRVLIGLTSREARWFAAVANDHMGWPQCCLPAAQPDPARQSADGAFWEKHSRTGS